jgi:Helix-turn-helix domain
VSTAVRSSRPRAIPPVQTGDVLTVEEFCAALKVSKDTFYHWRKVGTAPVCHRLPNGELRISCADRDAWLATLRDVA